jgi:ribosome biogenesis GTPase A
MNINWYPGHMVKAKRMITENLKLVDLVVEILDARLPYSSRNPDFEKLFNNKKKVIVLNKYDLADPSVTTQWQKYYESSDIEVITVNSKTGSGNKDFINAINKVMADKFERDRLKGMKQRPVKAMICGIPNSGKSTFINKLTGSAPARKGDKPGVTKDRQWIKIHKNIHMLDTPGVLWPKFDDDKIALNLAITGAINDEILDLEQISRKLLSFLTENYSENLKKRYDLNELNSDPHKLLLDICMHRNFIKSGGEPDTLKAAIIILDEFRAGKIGRISLEAPNEF